MKLKIMAGLMLVCLAMTVCGYAGALTESERIESLEKKVQELEKNMDNTAKLTVEFADEIALLNVKVVSLEDQLKKK